MNNTWITASSLDSFGFSEPLMMKWSDSLESDTNQYSNRINRLKSENRAVRAGKKNHVNSQSAMRLRAEIHFINEYGW